MNETKFTTGGDGAKVVRFGEETINVRLEDGAKMPVKKYPTDSGADICSIENVGIPCGERRLIHTGIYLDIPYGYEVQVRSRSGLAAKNGVFVLNGIGTIDQTYNGEIMVVLQNLGNVPFEVEVGDRIAQLVLSPIARCEYKQVDSINDTDRGDGGFGSTGIK